MCNLLNTIFVACNLASAQPVELTPPVLQQVESALNNTMMDFVYPAEVPFAQMGCTFPSVLSRKGELIGDIDCEGIKGSYEAKVTKASRSLPQGTCSQLLAMEGQGPLRTHQTCGNLNIDLTIATTTR